jgi:hypothetical protein
MKNSITTKRTGSQRTVVLQRNTGKYTYMEQGHKEIFNRCRGEKQPNIYAVTNGRDEYLSCKAKMEKTREMALGEM